MVRLSNFLSESKGWEQGELSILNLILLQQDILLGEGTGTGILREVPRPSQSLYYSRRKKLGMVQHLPWSLRRWRNLQRKDMLIP